MQRSMFAGRRIGGAIVIVEIETFDEGDIASIEMTSVHPNFLNEVSEDDILEEENDSA